MNKEKLNRLLDSIYELEGLVHLALAREDIPDSLPLLIRRKGEELSLHAKDVAMVDSENEAVRKPIVETETLTTQETTTVFEPLPQPEPEPGSEPQPEPGSEPQPEPKPETVVEPVQEPTPEPVLEPVQEPNPEPVLEPAQGPNPEPVFEPIQESNPEPVFEPETTEREETRTSRNEFCEPRGRLVFSINDRYRFKRELFCNSDADFNTTLALVASMDGFDEAEDYFIGELQWDSKRQEVIDFLEILKKYFKS